MNLIKINDAVGKTIAEVGYDNVNEYLGIRFDDGSFAVLEIDRYGESQDIRDIDRITPDEAILVKIGVITEEERQAERAKRDAQRKAMQEANERAQYEKLKAKFED